MFIVKNGERTFKVDYSVTDKRGYVQAFDVDNKNQTGCFLPKYTIEGFTGYNEREELCTVM